MSANAYQLKEVRNHLHFTYRHNKYKLKAQLILANI